MVRAYLPQSSPPSISTNSNYAPQGQEIESITPGGANMLYETGGVMQYETTGSMEYET